MNKHAFLKCVKHILRQLINLQNMKFILLVSWPQHKPQNEIHNTTKTLFKKHNEAAIENRNCLYIVPILLESITVCSIALSSFL